MDNFDLRTPNVIECHYFSSRTISLEQSKRIVTTYELDFNLNGGRTNVTFWVNFTETETGYLVHRAYSHRMNVMNR